MRFVLICWSFTYAIGCFSQSDINTGQPKFKSDKNGKQGYWEVKEYDGTVIGKGKYKNDLKTGYWEYFNLDGLKDSEGKFVKGQQHGIWKFYFYPDGTESSKLINIDRYKMGLYDGNIQMDW